MEINIKNFEKSGSTLNLDELSAASEVVAEFEI